MEVDISWWSFLMGFNTMGLDKKTAMSVETIIKCTFSKETFRIETRIIWKTIGLLIWHIRDNGFWVSPR